MSVLSAFNLSPLLAVSVADLILQVVIALLAVGLYHVWVSGRKAGEPPAIAPREQPPAIVPPVPVHSNVPVPSTTASVAVQPAVARTADTAPAEIAAVIAAAVAMVLGRPHRVVSVQNIGVAEARFNVWAHEGRQRIFDSHKFR
jgi:hypothetical protein